MVFAVLSRSLKISVALVVLSKILWRTRETASITPSPKNLSSSVDVHRTDVKVIKIQSGVKILKTLRMISRCGNNETVAREGGASKRMYNIVDDKQKIGKLNVMRSFFIASLRPSVASAALSKHSQIFSVANTAAKLEPNAGTDYDCGVTIKKL